jgi:hypothetical protein
LVQWDDSALVKREPVFDSQTMLQVRKAGPGLKLTLDVEQGRFLSFDSLVAERFLGKEQVVVRFHVEAPDL